MLDMMMKMKWSIMDLEFFYRPDFSWVPPEIKPVKSFCPNTMFRIQPYFVGKNLIECYVQHNVGIKRKIALSGDAGIYFLTDVEYIVACNDIRWAEDNRYLCKISYAVYDITHQTLIAPFYRSDLKFEAVDADS